MGRIAILASGGGSNAQSILEKIEAGFLDAEVAWIVSDQSAAGVLAVAKSHGVPSLVLAKLPGEARDAYDKRLRAVLDSANLDLIVLAGFMRILSPTFFADLKTPVVNIHPSLLPRHKGAHGVRDTLAAGDSMAGCTTHFVTPELDGGPHILQASLAIAHNESFESLKARVLEMEHWILPRTLDLVLSGACQLHGDAVRFDLRRSTSWKQGMKPKPEWNFPPEF